MRKSKVYNSYCIFGMVWNYDHFNKWNAKFFKKIYTLLKP